MIDDPDQRAPARFSAKGDDRRIQPARQFLGDHRVTFAGQGGDTGVDRLSQAVRPPRLGRRSRPAVRSPCVVGRRPQNLDLSAAAPDRSVPAPTAWTPRRQTSSLARATSASSASTRGQSMERSCGAWGPDAGIWLLTRLTSSRVQVTHSSPPSGSRKMSGGPLRGVSIAIAPPGAAHEDQGRVPRLQARQDRRIERGLGSRQRRLGVVDFSDQHPLTARQHLDSRSMSPLTQTRMQNSSKATRQPSARTASRMTRAVWPGCPGGQARAMYSPT